MSEVIRRWKHRRLMQYGLLVVADSALQAESALSHVPGGYTMLYERHTRRGPVSWLATAAAAAVLVPLLAITGVAQAAQGPGTVDVELVLPDGVPGSVVLDGKSDYVAAAGTSTTVTVGADSGAYKVRLAAIVVDGTRYVGSASRPEVVVRPDLASALAVTYSSDRGAVDFHATQLDETEISMAWDGPLDARYVLRKSVGDTPPSKLDAGQDVAIDGTTATDTGLDQGAEYSYSLFTKIPGNAWIGPFSIRVGTPSGQDSAASYVTTATTLLAQPDDLVSVTPTGDGVDVVLAASVATRVIGSAIVLPISPTLEGGYLGVVESIAPDGRRVHLVPGSLDQAFDYYDLSIDAFDTAQSPLASEVSGVAAPQVQKVASSGFAALSQPAAALLPGVACEGGTGTAEILEFDPDIDVSGHFNTTVDKYKFWKVTVPVGASVDSEFVVTATGAARVKFTGALKCDLDLPKVFLPLATAPVPISILITPRARFEVGGGVDVENVGLSVSAGYSLDASMSVAHGVDIDTGPILDASPLTPKIIGAHGLIRARVGGFLTLGPGAGTTDAGAIIGVGGDFYPIDASFSPYFDLDDSRYDLCTEIRAGASGSLYLEARAWISKWTISSNYTLLDGVLDYGGSPWYLPSGCQDLEEEEPATDDTLYGDGIEDIEDEVVGSDDQWGYVDGFVPGKKTWVLSTGLLADAIGVPGDFASTDLGLPGDAALSALAGNQTYDAVRYTSTFIPTGSTVHVSYVFASEEYPEFVGSVYNDVMEVLVNGQLCSSVPGTNQPVSINTINAFTNSQFYVDNATGAAGYATSMDALTVPLTCEVDVTPGVPTVVTIAVADASDGIYDSAVALAEKGIWSD